LGCDQEPLPSGPVELQSDVPRGAGIEDSCGRGVIGSQGIAGSGGMEQNGLSNSQKQLEKNYHPKYQCAKQFTL
jgi:hypothetical protein